jgi:YD repeat-containing protein
MENIMQAKALAAASLAMIATAAVASETISYSYDARGRLVKVQRTGTVNNGITTTYTHDKANNRVNRTTTGAP